MRIFVHFKKHPGMALKTKLWSVMGMLLILSPISASAANQVQFAKCEVTIRADGFRKAVGTLALTTTTAWYGSHGYSSTLKATLQQNVKGMLDAKYGKNNYKTKCSKALSPSLK